MNKLGKTVAFEKQGDNMELLKKSKITIAITLSLIGCLLILFFSSCGGESELFLEQYERRNAIKDNEGNQYKVVYESKDRCDICVYKSTDGQNWNKIGTIPSHGYEGYKVWGYSLTCEDNNILSFVYVGIGKGGKTIYFSKSLDNGSTWTEPVAVNDDIQAQRSYPKITSKGENIFIAWLEENERSSIEGGKPSGIYFSSSSDGGRSWNENSWIREGEDFWITVVENETICLTYVGGKMQNIGYLSYSRDRGKNWQTETTGELSTMVREPYTIVKNGLIYLIFQGTIPTTVHFRPGTSLNHQVYYLKSADRGKSWSRIIRLREKGVIK